MFEVVWGPLIAVMAMAMETTDDAATVEICLEGFKLGIHVAGILGMATERDSMVAALCNFTALDPISGSHTPVSVTHSCFSWNTYAIVMLGLFSSRNITVTVLSSRSHLMLICSVPC